jgi:hypothetical protein
MSSETASPSVARIRHLTLWGALALAVITLLVLWQLRGVTLASSFLCSIITFFFSAILIGAALSILSPLFGKPEGLRR